MEPRNTRNTRTRLATAESTPTAGIQVGILLGTFGRGTLETRLDAVKASGLDCVQLSLDCAGLPDMPDEIPPKVADRQAKDPAWRFYRAVALTNAAGF